MSGKKVLIVDDSEINRLILEEILSDSYEIEHAADGIEAISKMVDSTDKPNVVLLDIMMPGMDGFEVINFIKFDRTLSKIPVIFITAANMEKKGLLVGAADYISKPFEPEIVKLRVANQLELSLYRDKLENMVEQKTNEIVSIKENFLHTMADLIEYRSLESGQHVKRTKDLVQILVMQMIDNGGKYCDELINQNYKALIDAVPLHDIGKIGIPDNILLKPGKLTQEEYEIMKTHTIIGGDVIKSLLLGSEDDYMRHCYNICRFHHERWDARGYPDKLKETETPLSARIVAVVDVYDALISERCYKKSFTHEEAIDIIKNESGTQFDPEIVGTLLQSQERFKEYNISYSACNEGITPDKMPK